MTDKNIRHSVLMISYNQEEYISAALDSVLEQIPMPYEIIISDDASKDRTWEIIETYKSRYPQIIKASRNEHNIGIYANINTVLKKATGDVVSWLSGDDYYRPGLFSEFNRIINENNINLSTDKFIISTNFEFEFTNGRRRTFDNFRLRNLDVFKQRIRYGVFYRMIGISRRILDEIELSRTDVGIHADWLLDLSIENACDRIYFTPFVSSIYRAGVGIVSRTKSVEMYASRLIVIEEIKRIYAHRLDSKDLKYLNYEVALNSYLIKDDFYHYFMLWCAYLKNLTNFPVNNPAFSKERVLTLLPPKCRNLLKRMRQLQRLKSIR